MGHLKKRWRTKRRTKDLDQIDTDLTVGKVEKFLNQTVDYDKTGLGQFYCVHCSNAFKAHIKSKPHKRRLHALKTQPYTVLEAERAAGLGSYIQPTKRKMETLLPAAVVNEETLADVKKRAKLESIEADGDISIVDEGDVKM